MTLEERKDNTYYDKTGKQILVGDLLKVFHFRSGPKGGKINYMYHVVVMEETPDFPVMSVKGHYSDNPIVVCTFALTKKRGFIKQPKLLVSWIGKQNERKLKYKPMTKKGKTLLWLDDVRDPLGFAGDSFGNWLAFSPIQQPFETVWVKSYGEFRRYIVLNGLPTAICFDHDLGDNFELRQALDINIWFDLQENREFTGYDCAKWLVSYCMDNNEFLPVYNIHSANPAGKENIDCLLKNFIKFQNK